MKQRIKRNNRRKAVFGIDDAIMIGIGLLGAGLTVANAENQNTIADKQQRQRFLANNEINAQTFLGNQGESANYYKNNDIETARTSYLSTINNQFCCGGKRRMKKDGGTISANIKGFGRYI